MSEYVELVDGDVVARIAPWAGGRLASVEVAGTELLVGGDELDMSWGSFPMAPWAGRVRRGRFVHDGAEYQLTVNHPPHAIHGTTFTRPWSVESSDGTSVRLRIDLGDGWPLGGWASQRITVSDGVVRCELSVTAADRWMPAQVGWHPWFRSPSETRLRFGGMYLRDDEGIPTGEIVRPGPGPWDDCFVDPSGPPRLVVPGRRGTPDVEVVMESDCECWVVYDRPDHAICIEPQSGPPDGLSIDPVVLGPGETLRHWMTWTVSVLP